jgi:hypothetical protein
MKLRRTRLTGGWSAFPRGRGSTDTIIFCNYPLRASELQSWGASGGGIFAVLNLYGSLITGGRLLWINVLGHLALRLRVIGKVEELVVSLSTSLCLI